MRRPGLPAVLQPFVVSLEGLGVIPDFRKALNLRWRPSPDESGTFGYIDVDGRVWLGGACGTAKRLGKPEAGEGYLRHVADAIGGSVRRHEKSWPEVVGGTGRSVDAADLLAAAAQWKAAMSSLMADLRDQA